MSYYYRQLLTHRTKGISQRLISRERGDVIQTVNDATDDIGSVDRHGDLIVLLFMCRVSRTKILRLIATLIN